MLVPAEPGAAACRLDDPRRVEPPNRARAGRTRAGRRGCCIGERHRLLGGQRSSGRCPGRSSRSRPLPGHSAIRGRNARPCRCARPARSGVSGPASASAWYRPSLSPITTSAAFSVGADLANRAEYELHKLALVDFGLLADAHDAAPGIRCWFVVLASVRRGSPASLPVGHLVLLALLPSGTRCLAIAACC